MIADERETVVNATDGDDIVRIWTAQRKHINRLRKHPSFTEVGSGDYEGSPWAAFTIPAGDWNPASGAKRKRDLTDEQRAALSDRMRAIQARGKA